MVDEQKDGRSGAGAPSGSQASPGAASASPPSVSIPNAFAALKAAIHADPDYAWGWHCNLAVPMMDAAGVEHGLANSAAALIMRQMFDYDMAQHPLYEGPISAAQAYFEMRVAAEREEDAASGIVAATAGETACGLDERSEQSPVGEAETPNPSKPSATTHEG